MTLNLQRRASSSSSQFPDPRRYGNNPETIVAGYSLSDNPTVRSTGDYCCNALKLAGSHNANRATHRVFLGCSPQRKEHVGKRISRIPAQRETDFNSNMRRTYCLYTIVNHGKTPRKTRSDHGRNQRHRAGVGGRPASARTATARWSTS